ncbi:molybdopterin oxidoreductase, alpha subunit [Catenovulum agarivorans DS-2]|uniref:Molybdopterin oxidoreductase, alpha subunit n=1 Tax=Catenovulum agarivorans DS-2 TaxID=1328313 RepID=W7QP39_9ALTE|nr:FdhF/YdeP family oxidoreductase [Catenovulum agarivorans]EWH10737.1 molybdopterin oxidoreductase, alpha subunit [Catenovulum agarivorans DS-2]
MQHKTTQKPNKAGGFPSIKSTVKHIVKSQRASDNFKNLLRANQDKGFDCPGCAWGDKKEGLFQFCENGAKAIAWEATNKKVDSAFFNQYPVSYLKEQSHYWLEYQGRLTQPVRYNSQTDKFEAINWSTAFKLIAQHLRNLDHPNQLELYTSGRASNEAAFIYQLFGRSFGTNNFPDCSNMCHEASGVALNQTIGIGKGTVVLDDFDQAEVIFVYGQNPGTNHPRMMNALRSAAKSGCKIATFNNLKEVALEKFASPQDPTEVLTNKATKISHVYFSPKLGGDFAAIRGISKIIFERFSDKLNSEFIQTHTQSFTQYRAEVAQTDWQQIELQSGLSKSELKQAAELYTSSSKVISCWAMGITQHKHSVDTIKEIVNLHLMLGLIGHKGAGLCPVRGHSNVQGNRTVGINEKPTKAFIDGLNQHFQQHFSYDKGHNVYQALKALHTGTSKALICLGGNLAAAAPDSEFTEQAISNAQLNVQIATKLNRSHLMVNPRSGCDTLLLPCLGRTEIDRQRSGEQKITVEDTFSMVHASAGKNQPIAQQCMSEVAIVAEIADATIINSQIDWLAMRDNYAIIRDHIAASIKGFDNFNQQIEQPCGFHLKNSAAQLQWNTPSQKAQFSASKLPLQIIHNDYLQSNDSFVLQTLRSHDQYNTTVYGYDDRYRGIQGARDIVFISQADADAQHINQGDLLDIESTWQDGKVRKITGFKAVIYDIPQGNLAAYYPETNPLVPIDSIGDGSFTPTSKSIVVKLRKSQNQTILQTK